MNHQPSDTQSPKASYRWIFPVSIALISLMVNGRTSPAQTLPNPDPRPAPDPPTELEIPVIPPPVDLLPPAPTPPPSNAPAGRFAVQDIQIVGSTIFTAADWQEEIAALVGQTVGYDELFTLRDAINQRYQDQGYLTTGAIIQPIDPQTGVITFQVIEGRLEAIQIQGNRRLNGGYIRRQLAAATEAPLNIHALQTALQQLQVDPLIKRLESELSAGTQLGTNLLTVRIEEAKTLTVTSSLNNNRSPSVGSLKRGVTVSEANVTGWGDRADITYTNTDGSFGWEFSYTLPLNADRGTVRLSHSTSTSTIIEDPFDVLDIRSNSATTQLAWRQPLWRSLTEEGAIGLTLSQQASNTSLLGIPFPLSAGADDEGRLSVTAIRLAQDWTRRSEAEILAARSQFSFGVPWLNATNNETGPDTEFFSWRGQAQWIRQLAPQTLLVVRGDAQWSDRPLVSFEKFSLGGQSTVRGYRQDVLLSDGGVLGSVELRWPIWRDRATQSLVQLVPFMDWGYGWNHGDGSELLRQTLWSTGLGLRWQVGNDWSVRLDWGIPLVNQPDTSNASLQESGLYFSVDYSPRF